MNVKVPVWILVMVLVLGALVWGGIWGYGQVKYSHDSSWKAQQSYAWLAQIVGKDEKGQPITRAMLIDGMIQQMIQSAQRKQQPQGKK